MRITLNVQVWVKHVQTRMENVNFYREKNKRSSDLFNKIKVNCKYYNPHIFFECIKPLQDRL
jgi:hypothetical protein